MELAICDTGRHYDIFYVEWDQGAFKHVGDDGGDAWLQLPDGSRFDVKATTQTSQPRPFMAKINYSSIVVANNVQNQDILLATLYSPPSTQWIWANCILSGETGGNQFWGANPPSNWMHQMLGKLGSLTLRQLCLPFSHDAGMSVINGETGFSNSANTQTQTLNIGQQLNAGVRFFDLRPVITSGKFAAGHYSNTGNSTLIWQGSNGQYLTDIIAQINSFTQSNPEFFIFELSHAYDTDTGEPSYLDFTQDQWNNLFHALSGVQNMFNYQDTSADLTTLPLSTLIGNGKAAVIFTLSVDSIDLSQWHGKGFYYGISNKGSQLNYTGSYSNSDNAGDVQTDQLQKLCNNRPNTSSLPFLIEYTLTLKSAWANISGSIIDSTQQVQPLLYRNMLDHCTTKRYPNLIGMDNISADATSLAIAVNNRFAAFSTQSYRRGDRCCSVRHERRHELHPEVIYSLDTGLEQFE